MCLLFLFRANQHAHLAAFKLRRLLNHAHVRDIDFDFLQLLHAQLLVRHFTTTEAQGDFDLVTFFQETLNGAQLDLVISLFSAWAQLDLFDLYLMLLFLGFFGFLLDIKQMLIVVHDFTDRRFGVGNDLDEIKLHRFRSCKRITQGYDPFLFSVLVDETDFAGANFAINGGTIGFRNLRFVTVSWFNRSYSTICRPRSATAD